MTLAELVAQIVGLAIVIITMLSAMLTVVVPRSDRPLITRAHFRFVSEAFFYVGRRFKSAERRDWLESRLAPFALVTLSFVWVVQVMVGFALFYWGRGIGGFSEALVLSGSSLTTLGIASAEGVTTMMFVVAEALIGLGLVGLMIAYLPTIYGAYTEREVAVARLEVRAGRPPHPINFLYRNFRIGWIDRMDAVWSEWENWFLNIEESHTTHTSLVLFRSAYYGRSWLVAAGTVLDTAALMLSTVDVEFSPRAALCLRSGFTTLGSLADAHRLDRPQDPAPDDPITIRRETFDRVYDHLARDGVPVVADRDQAWRDFAGWRVNYDASLYVLMERLRIEPGEWFGPTQTVPEPPPASQIRRRPQ